MKRAPFALSFCVTALLPLAVACGGRNLDAGNDLDAGRDGQPDHEGGGPLPSGSCSTLTWGNTLVPASTSDCESLFLGRWALCSNEGGSPQGDSGFPLFLPQPAGIEFAEESGALRFYVLVPGDAGSLARSQAFDERGAAVDPAVLGSSCKFWMAPDSNPGSQTGWTLERFQGPDALLANGSASYVPAP